MVIPWSSKKTFVRIHNLLYYIIQLSVNQLANTKERVEKSWAAGLDRKVLVQAVQHLDTIRTWIASCCRQYSTSGCISLISKEFPHLTLFNKAGNRASYINYIRRRFHLSLLQNVSIMDIWKENNCERTFKAMTNQMFVLDVQSNGTGPHSRIGVMNLDFVAHQ